jgi:hypothetical protein
MADSKRGRKDSRIVHRGDVYLANDKAERKATGSYYTPENVVEYIIANTVGPVLDRKLEALVPDFRKSEKTYHRELTNAKNDPRCMLGSGISRLGNNFTPEQMRMWAGGKAYEAHRDLVDKLFDLKILDPAMGSGHFLVDAVDFVTDKLLVWLNQFRPFNPVLVMLQRTRRNILESLNTQNVNIDPDRLTDVHLLKRHVLKRCIYGVDLNPLATELAKVSLWLDAFTLGAPLSFLDHHLRVGNSLIGATFEDLQKLTSGMLFAIDYEPMLRAVRNVLTVSRLSDTTAAEVHESADKYSSARSALDGYRLVLDLVVAQHFEQPKAPQLITQAGELKLDSREHFLMQLTRNDSQIVRDVEQISRARQFFHWELEFPEVFFSYKEGSKQNIERKSVKDSGFECVIGNPPYDVISEKETGQELKCFQAYIASSRTFDPSRVGKNNLYKLFICRAVSRVQCDGRVGVIVPMSVLGDEQAIGIRKLFFSEGRFTGLEVFPQKDDPSKRVFEEAKLSTAIVLFERSSDPANQKLEFISRVHPENKIVADSPSLKLSTRSIPLYDPSNLTIISCSQQDWDLASRILLRSNLTRFGEVASPSQGEVNETNETDRGNIVPKRAGTKLILRGSNVCLYITRDASQGEELYLDIKSFLHGRQTDSKAFDHRQARVVWQNLAAQNNFRRLIAASVPAGEFCNHALSYVTEKSSKVDLRLLLAVLNSNLAEWFFRLGSTNNNILQYLINNIPFPRFRPSPTSVGGKPTPSPKIIAPAQPLATVERDLFDWISKDPEDHRIAGAIVGLVERLIELEATRGNIGRAERSSLSAGAQPFQELIDRAFYALAGLTTSEAVDLEKRLSSML